MASLTIKTSTSNFNQSGSQSGKLSGNAKEKGLDITLDDPAIQSMQMSLGEWSNASAWLIKVVNYVLGRLDFKENNNQK